MFYDGTYRRIQRNDPDTAIKLEEINIKLEEEIEELKERMETLQLEFNALNAEHEALRFLFKKVAPKAPPIPAKP